MDKLANHKDFNYKRVKDGGTELPRFDRWFTSPWLLIGFYCKLAAWIGNPSKVLKENCEKVAKDEKIGTKSVIGYISYRVSYKKLLWNAYGNTEILWPRRILFVLMVNPSNRYAWTE